MTIVEDTQVPSAVELENNVKQHLILFCHGSRDPRWREPFESLVEEVKECCQSKENYAGVSVAYMEMADPKLLDILKQTHEKEGVNRFAVLPLFMSAGAHVSKDIPAQVKEAQVTYPTIDVTVLPPVGEHELVRSAMRQIAVDALG